MAISLTLLFLFQTLSLSNAQGATGKVDPTLKRKAIKLLKTFRCESSEVFFSDSTQITYVCYRKNEAASVLYVWKPKVGYLETKSDCRKARRAAFIGISDFKSFAWDTQNYWLRTSEVKALVQLVGKEYPKIEAYSLSPNLVCRKFSYSGKSLKIKVIN